MLAGIVGILLSLAGLVGVYLAKPVLTTSITNTVDTLNNAVETSKSVMTVTNDALGATVTSVEALSEVLATTADTLGDTQPVVQCDMALPKAKLVECLAPDRRVEIEIGTKN